MSIFIKTTCCPCITLPWENYTTSVFPPELGTSVPNFWYVTELHWWKFSFSVHKIIWFSLQLRWSVRRGENPSGWEAKNISGHWSQLDDYSIQKTKILKKENKSHHYQNYNLTHLTRCPASGGGVWSPSPCSFLCQRRMHNWSWFGGVKSLEIQQDVTRCVPSVGPRMIRTSI